MIPTSNEGAWLDAKDTPGPPAPAYNGPNSWRDVYLKDAKACEWLDIPLVARELFLGVDPILRQEANLIWCDIAEVEDLEAQATVYAPPVTTARYCMVWLPKSGVFGMARDDTVAMYNIPEGRDEVDCATDWLKGRLSPVLGVRSLLQSE